MIRIGITGQSGFIGGHLLNMLKLRHQTFECVNFKDDFFQKEECLREFVRNCDVIVHLAAMNRDSDSRRIYETNLKLVKQLIEAMEIEKVKPYVLFSSSIQEENDNEYGSSKREGRQLLEQWAKKNKASFSGLVIPNVFGPFCRPNYNSFVATFCHKLTHGEIPQVLNDDEVNLIYVGSLCEFIIKNIEENRASGVIKRIIVSPDFKRTVQDVLSLMEKFKDLYFDKGCIPPLEDQNSINLFNTFRSYIDHDKYFPIKLLKNEDARGFFVETIKLGVGGQVSFSTTVPGITRGNHYHIRKIERFTVVKGKARIQLRRIGCENVFDFYLDGDNPAYVDMPIWYTHNIMNIGDTDLYTQFWINEWYDQSNSDTYFEEV